MNITPAVRHNLFTTCIIASLVASPWCSAEELQFVPRVWAGVSDYHFKQGPRKGAMPDGSDFPAVHFDATLYMAGIGLTSVYESFYLDLSYQDSSDDHDSFSGADYYEKFTGNRKDYSATLGMKLLDNKASLYVGYKNGKTTGKGHKGTKLTFTEDGFFVGASYAWLIANKGLLAVNGAFARLDGNLKEVPGPIYPRNLGMDADSKTDGLSYGVSWTSKMTDRWSYSIALDANDYKFSSLKDNSNNTPLPDDITERLYTARFSIYYSF